MMIHQMCIIHFGCVLCKFMGPYLINSSFSSPTFQDMCMSLLAPHALTSLRRCLPYPPRRPKISPSPLPLLPRHPDSLPPPKDLFTLIVSPIPPLSVAAPPPPAAILPLPLPPMITLDGTLRFRMFSRAPSNASIRF